MTKDDLIAVHLSDERVTCRKNDVTHFRMKVLRVAARLIDGEIRIQADVWSGWWKDPCFTVELSDILPQKPPSALRPAIAVALDKGRHWLYDAMERQTPVKINSYDCQGIRGWRVCGVVIERLRDGRLVVGAECRSENCPHCIVSANPRQMEIDREDNKKSTF